MATSLYNQSIPVFVHYLKVMDNILKKGEAFADAKGKKHEEVIMFRMAPDMRALDYQVQAVCNDVVWFADRVGQLSHVEVADDEQTFEQLHARIARTISYLEEKVDKATLDAQADKPVQMVTKSVGTFHWNTAQEYLSLFVIANFHFHLSTAYCLLRQQGVELGAFDYFGNIFKKAE
ncbi:hypothetical protein F4780DRAFT_738154 [Xylariomycetidae sp. FL0641]|nr:hypothetical protein F4780DRAFT_738154 [Xylariomycetidae sp. FL0641]